jgi:peptide methionine sulfoxide reductase MsrB
MTSRSAEHRNRSQRLLFFTNFRHHSETGFWPNFAAKQKEGNIKKRPASSVYGI